MCAFRNRFLGLLALGGMAFLNWNCNKPEKIPAWIYVSGYDINVFGSQGTANHQLTEVYAYSPTRFLGAYPIPGLIPILEDGPTKIDLFPGIRANGIKAFPDVYPFLTTFSANIDLKADHIDTIRPSFTYHPIAKFRMIEHFEDGVTHFKQTLFGQQMIVTTDAFEGTYSGEISLSKNEPIFECVSPIIPEIPANGTPIYVEINYRNEVPFIVGLMGEVAGIIDVKEYHVGLRPSNTWNKVYISLTDPVNIGNVKDFRLLIRADFQSSDTTIVQKVWVDNIKLIHQ